MKSDQTSKIIHKIGLEFNLSDEAVREIIMTQFKYLHTLISSGDKEYSRYNNYRMPLFGLFLVSDKRRQLEQIKFYNRDYVKDSNAGKS